MGREKSHPGLRLSLSVGLGQSREDLLPPLPKLGPSLQVDITGSLTLARWSFQAQVRTLLFVGFDRTGAAGGALEPALELQWRYLIAGSRGASQVALGLFVGVREILGYWGSWDDSHLYWLGCSALGPSVLWVTRTGARWLELELKMPGIAWVSRPPRYRLNKIDPVTEAGYWLSRFADQPSLTSWHEFQAFQFRVHSRVGLGRGGFEPFVGVDFTRFSLPQPAVYLLYLIGMEIRR